MKRILSCLLTRKISLLFFTVLFFLSLNCWGQITYVGSATNPADNAALNATTVAVTPPTMVTGDLVVMISHSRITANTHTLNVTGGQTWTTEATASTTSSTSRIFWCRYNGTWAANPSINFGTGTATGVVMHVFRPTIGTNLWSVDVAQQVATFTNASSNITITGQTTIHNSAVTVASWFSTDDNTWGGPGGGWTTTGGAQYRINSTNDNSSTYAHFIRTTPGTTGNVTKSQTANNPDAGQTSIISFYEYTPPANDLCSGAVLLTSGTTCTNTAGNLQYAGSVAPAGTCGGATATTTYAVWYRFVANSTTHAITLSSLGSNLTAATTYIETFSGACGGLTSLGCQDASTTEVIGGLTIGTTYYVRIYVTTAPTNVTTANYNFNICIQQPPANDDCTGAVNLTPGAACVNTAGTLHVATANATGIPLGCFAAGTYYDVWYRFTATTFTHTVTLSSLGANITAPRIQIYSGTCGALVSESCVSGTSLTEANLTPGVTYYIRVANYNADPSGTAGFNICVTNNPPPANDVCASSTLLTSGFACTNTTGNLQYAASNGLAGACGSATATTTYDVWYRFVANSTTHYVTLSGLGSNLSAATTYIETFSSTGACAGLTSIACQNAGTIEILSGLTIGSTYYVRVYITNPPNNATTANWNFSICIQQPPANDECAGAVNLTAGSTCVNTAGTINLATENATIPLGCFAAGTYYDVWYRFTAVTTIETITLSSLGANFTAPRIQIYSGTCGSLTSIACASGTSLLQYGLTVGATYYVRIANYNVNPLTAANFNICITYITPPANDECTGAVTLTSAATCGSPTGGTLLNSSPNSSGLPACGNSGSAEVWYKFIASSNRPVITLGSLGANLSAASPYMQLFSGLCGSLTSLACVAGTSINTAVNPGGVGLTINSTYYIRITTNTNTSVPTSGNWGFTICITDPSGAAVDFAKTYVNITDGTAGGTIDPGDVLEIRSILVVQRPGSSSANVAIDSIAFYDTLSANKGFRLLKDSMALKTNEGKLFRPTNSTYFTDASADADAAWITTAGAGTDTALQINMGTGATRTARGKLGHNSRPSNFGNTCIIMATYRVRVTAAYGTKIEYGGGAFRYRDSTTGVFYVVNFPADSLIVYSSPGACPDAASATNVVGDEFGGTFGAPTGSPVYPQNRGTSANTNYAYATFGGGNGPGDYYYGIANNTSGNGTIVQTVPKPTATTRVFGVWDITGDHTGAANTGSTSKGNLPCNLSLPISATNPCGYMLVVNSAYRADVAFEYNFSGACTETYYEISAWMKNVCSKCGCDSTGAGSTNAGYQATAPGDSSGIKPNLAIQINGIDYYTTGDIVHQGVGTGISSTRSDTLNMWIKRSFVYKTQPGETSFNMTFRNNAPGGGGNDWAIDDISIRTCYPNMTYSPSVNPNACANSSITITDTVRSYYNTYTEYKWQRSTDGGTTWVDIAGTTATATPVIVNGLYQFVTTYTVPAAFTTPANNGDKYRVVVATNATNLASLGCSFSDVIPITITVTQPSTAPTSITGADICNPASVTLTAIGGTLGTSANYQWGTGSVVGTSPIVGATNSTLTVSPTTTTTYWVRVENTTSPCPAVTSGLTKTITVSQPSTAPTSITGADICSGSSSTLTALGGTLGSGANYQWGTGSTPGANPIGGATSSTLTVSPTTTTTYWVKIKNTTSPCADSTAGVTKIITVTQASAAPTSITGANICNGSSTTLTAIGGTLGSGANYQWGTGSTPGANPIGGATSSTLTVSPASTTTYWVKIKNTTSPCADSTAGVTRTITVSQPSAAPTSITGLDICNGSSTTLTALGGTLGSGANYQWGTGSTPGANPIGGATSSTLTVSPASTTTYWVKIKNTTSPCADSTAGVTRTITVSLPSVAPASISGPNICGSGSTTLTAVGGTLGTGANYQWGIGSTPGANPIGGATSSTLTVSPASTTTYWVKIKNTTSPCADSTAGVTRTVTINQSSIVPSGITGLDFCNPGSTTLTATGATLGTSANYQWGTGSVVGTSPIAGATNSTLTVSPTSTTTYWVRIENTASPCTANTGGITKLITVSQPSVAATSAGKNKNNICPGISAKIFHTGGSLGTTASWKWYTGSPGGTLIGSGDTLTVTPLVTTTYYVRAEGFCNTTAPQSVTIFISCDIDKDKDGIPDYIESNIPAATANGYNTAYPGYVDYNNDFINDNFQADGDSDNDGIPNYLDTDFPGRVDSNSDGIDDRFDTDLDGKINMLDLDSDNDGIPDVVEANGVDTDGDGKIDNFTDTDGDGLSQNVDANNTGANNSSVGLGVINFDNDAVPNFLDLDSDNDGIPDVVEVGGPDTNNDGKIDGFVDANNDGLHDGYINATALLKTGTDTNGDGRADSYPNKNLDRDFRPNAYDLDSDGDGIVDVIEAGLPDANLNGIVDGIIGTNGWSTSVSALGSLGLRNSDTDGKPDYLDIDSDDDGIPDNIEGQPTATYKLPTLTDADGDGLMLPYDNVPAAFGGSGIFVYDHDGDNTPDYRDTDSDADGLSDRVEGNDYNLNGLADDNITPTGLDTDGDGLDNRYDSLNSVTNIKGTSYRMGTNGSFTGDATPGSRTTVQKRYASQTDRDWRFTSFVLPVQFLSFTGAQNNNNVLLKWSIIADKEVDRFEIERSSTNSNFEKIKTLAGPVILQIRQNFSATDDITNINSDIIYYRLKVIGKDGTVKYSNVIFVRKKQTQVYVSIMPNPANRYVDIIVDVDANKDATIMLIDRIGKRVLVKNVKLVKGFNKFTLTLDQYSAGVYTIIIETDQEKISKQLVIVR